MRLQHNRSADGRAERSAEADKKNRPLSRSEFFQFLEFTAYCRIAGIGTNQFTETLRLFAAFDLQYLRAGCCEQFLDRLNPIDPAWCQLFRLFHHTFLGSKRLLF